MRKLKIIFNNIKLSRVVCDHLFSKSHTEVHRIGIGFIIMGMGVFVSKIPTSIHAIHFLLDGIGYGIHGIGIAPIIDKLASLANKGRAEIEKSVEPVEVKEDNVEV
jgi:hypothetical protein